jgi:ABC-2 type transport system ATP-binding protein
LPGVEAINLTRIFGELRAVDSLSFRVEPGEILGLLGPNGSGKTTTIRMLSCLISATSGEAYVAGHNIRSEPLLVRESVGVLTENPSLYERLTAVENLEFYAKAYGMRETQQREDRIKELLEFFILWDRRNDRVTTFSKGMKQKLAIARAIIHSPKVLFLDEPTAGLDPKASKDIRDLMVGLSQQEKRAILLCTHNLEDAEKLCKQVIIISNGKTIEKGTTDELRRRIAGKPKLAIHLTQLTENIIEAVNNYQKTVSVDFDFGNALLILELEDPENDTPGIIKQLVMADGRIRSVQLQEPSLEEAYLKLVKEASV